MGSHCLSGSCTETWAPKAEGFPSCPGDGMEQAILRTVSGSPEWEQVTAAGAGIVAWLGRISVTSRSLMQPSVSPWATDRRTKAQRWAHLCPCGSQ